MPATRSRTENWKQSLREIHDRRGALEITLPHRIEHTPSGPVASDQPGANLIWRVRIVGMTDDEIIVEEPMALGRSMPITRGAKLVGIIAIGQNRWMFETECLGTVESASNGYMPVRALRLRMPTGVERCQRRNFYRISTVGLSLPKVDCRKLLDLSSAAIAEAANRVAIHDLEEATISGLRLAPADPVLPEAGPPVGAVMVNVGGGGVGLMFEPDCSGTLEAEKPMFFQVDLRPHIPAPLCVTGRIKHTHIDSAQRVYAGIAFEFGHDPQHQKFIVDQLCRYVSMVQKEQFDQRQAA